MRLATLGSRLPIAVLCLTLALPSSARAEPGADPVPIGRSTMTEDLRTFFRGEKIQAAMFMGLGASTMIAGGVLVSRDGFARATAYPLLGVGLLQAIVGAGIFFRTDRQVARLTGELERDPAKVRASELKRIRGIHNSYRLVELAEIAMVASGTTLLVWGATENRDLLKGIGLGLLIQGALTLPMDLVADARARRYTEALLRFQVTVATLPLPGPAAAHLPAPLALLVDGRF